MPLPTTRCNSRGLQRRSISTLLLLTLSLSTALAGQETHNSDVVAVVNGRTVTAADLDAIWQRDEPGRFLRLTQEIYDGRKKSLDELIIMALLQQEATSLHVSVEALTTRIDSAIAAPTEDEFTRFYLGSGDSARGVALAQSRPRIIAFLNQQRKLDARRTYAQQLRAKYKGSFAVMLPPFRHPVSFDAAAPRRGRIGAAVQIVAFSDFQCPYCKQTMPILGELVEKYSDTVELVWVNYPLASHHAAKPAAEGSMCAQEQGRFWEFHDLLFQKQAELSASQLPDLASQVGIDRGLFQDCLAQRRYAQFIQNDISRGTASGVVSTPTVFINGRSVRGSVPKQVYEQIIQEELRSVITNGTVTGRVTSPE